MGKNKRKRTDKHHILPQSRFGTDDPTNIAKVNVQQHNDYHRIFGNRTPQEIIRFLVEDFWGGNWEYVDEARDIEETLRRC